MNSCPFGHLIHDRFRRIESGCGALRDICHLSSAELGQLPAIKGHHRRCANVNGSGRNAAAVARIAHERKRDRRLT